MNHTTAEANAEYERCLAECAAFVKAGNKIKQGPLLMREIPKGTINKRSHDKSDAVILAGLTPDEKVRVILTQYKALTRRELSEHTALSTATITKAVKSLEEENFLERAYGREVTFKLVRK